jgi:hypothetical protein
LTVTSTLTRKEFIGTGVATEFDLSPMRVFSAAELRVTVNGAVLPSFTFVADGNGSGEVLITPAPANLAAVVIEANPAFTQQIDFENEGPYLPETQNEGLDRSVARDLVLKAGVDRSVRVDSSSAPIAPLTPVPGQFLTWTSGGQIGNSSGTGADAGLRTDLAQPDGAELVNFGSKSLGFYINVIKTVEYYGAAGDGVAYDSAAINLACATDNRVVFRPDKTYRINQSMPLATDRKFIGEGAIILVDANVAAVTNTTGASVLFAEMENLILRANQNIAASCLALVDTSWSKFRNIRQDRAVGGAGFAYFVRLQGSVSACYWNKFFDVVGTALTVGGFRIGAGSNDNFFYDARLINHISAYPTELGIWLENGSNNQFFGASLEAIWDAPGAANAYAVRIDTGCDGNGFYGLRTEGHGASVNHFAINWNGGRGNVIQGHRLLGMGTHVGDPQGNEWDGLNVVGGAAAGYMGSTQVRMPFSPGAPASDAGAMKYNTTNGRFQGFRDSARDFCMSPAFFAHDMGNQRIDNCQLIALADGITAPAAVAGQAILFVDAADGDLKVRFGDGLIKVVAFDT